MSEGQEPPSQPTPVAVTLSCGHQASVMPEHFGGAVKCPTCGQAQPLPRSAEVAAIASQPMELSIPEDTGDPSPFKAKPKKPIEEEPVAWPWFMVLPFAGVISVGLTIMAREIGEPWHPAGIMAATCAVFFLAQLGLMVVPVRLLCHSGVGRGSVLATAITGGFIGGVIVVASVGVLVQWFLSSKGVAEANDYALTPFAAMIITGLVALLWFFFSLGFIQTAADEAPVPVVRRVLVMLLIGGAAGLVCVAVRGFASGVEFWTGLGIRALIAALVLVATPLVMIFNAKTETDAAPE